MVLNILKCVLLVSLFFFFSCSDRGATIEKTKLDLVKEELLKKESLLKINVSSLPEFTQTKEGELDKFEVTDQKQNIWIVVYISKNNEIDISFLELEEKKTRELEARRINTEQGQP